MRKRKLRVVVDTNLFVSGLILPRGNLSNLIKAWHDNLFTLVISSELLKELNEVLRRPRFIKYGLTKEIIDEIIQLVIVKSEKVLPTQSPVKVRDPKDEKVLVCALSGKADYLITGDEDLLTLKGNQKLGKLKIIKAKEFLQILRK